ncbi:zinc finger protein 64 [Elysia marginata]|uniref:Zinc finger protein 64 n=1 Tax=Elysia marginata TaxID=1093978 RepID=A0AAV4H7T7_9GAST|nr:zinc finger protein 64 [Elysia marginata]
MKGTENLHIKPINSNTQDEEEGEKESLEDSQETKSAETPSEDLLAPAEDPIVPGTSIKSGDGADSVCSSLSQWGVSDSPSTVTAEAAPCLKPEESEVSPSPNNKSTEGGSEGTKSGAPYARHYSCNYEDCTFTSKSAREHLYHLRDVHGNPNKIHECHLCEYASRYHNKIERHMVVHKLVINMEDRKGRSKTDKSDEFVAEDKNQEEEETEETVRPGGRLRVKPLKLRRLNVKMPFKVSGENTDSRSPPTLSPETVEKGILYEHLMSHSGHGYVQCSDCSYVTNSKTNFEKHRTFHEAVFPYVCTVCNFGADSENKIKRHATTQHLPSSGTIGTVSLHETTMDTSQESAKDTEADTTQEEYPEEDPDESTQSQNKGVVSSGAPSKIEYKCPKCVMVCYRRANFTRHLTARHGFSQLSASQLSKSMENKLFKSFKRRAVGGSNRAGGHVTVTENLKCPHCSYLAKWPSDLRRHMQVHTVLKRFKCSICPNKYKYLGDLNVHVRRDHNVEPPEKISSELTASGVIKKASPAIFRCPICPFSCHSKADLEQHSRTHGNITKTYQCRMCDYQTYWRGDVSRHLFRHHEVVLSKEATEIEEYFILRPDIRPLTKQAPASMSTSQAVFPRNPDPPMILDLSTSLEEVNGDETNGDEQIEQINLSLENMEEDQAATNDFNASDNAMPKLTPQSSLNLKPVCLKDGSFVCEYPNCDFKSTISDRMEVHLALHMNIKMFMCPTCGKRTNWKWDIVKHMNKVHMNPDAAVEDVITLSMEDAKATIGEYMATFERKSRELFINKCSLCDFKSLEKNRVVRHMGTVHKNQNGKVISQVIENPKELDITTFAQEKEKGIEASGMKSPTTENTTIPATFEEPSAEELAKFEKPYACAICKKPGVTKGDVKKHYNYTHPYKDVRVVFVGDGTEFNYYTGEIYSKNSKSFQDEASDSNDSNSNNSVLSAFSGKPVRPDSKYSNPKMHGYVKPFKCSICGIRSNWKWDLKKHLRSKHPGEGGFVIMLSIEEASLTYGTECSPSHPAVPVPRPSPINGRSSPFAASPSPTSSSNSLFKTPFNIKEEKLDDSYDNASKFEESSLLQQSPQYSPVSGTSTNGKGDRGTFIDPSRRQWKCSGCDYISNWRRNMARHIHRKHRGSEGTIKVIALHKLSASQLASLPVFNQQSISPFLSRRRSSNGNRINMHGSQVNKPLSNQNHPSGLRLWRCTKCSFKSVLKTHIIGHMQQHGIKPFKCGVCHLPFMNRGPLHKHLQKVHKCGDYIRQCKVVINYNDDDNSDAIPETGRGIVKSKPDNSMLRKISTPAHGKGQYVNSYFCRLCNIESSDREEILNHLEAFHNIVDNDNNILKIQKRIATPEPQDPPISPFTKNTEPSIRGSSGRKLHFCHVCPYRTQKKQMLAFHMTYHRPTVSNRYKCKYCPYYVSTVRLLHQHQRKWHESASALMSPQEQKTPPSSPFKPPSVITSSPDAGSGRRHKCEKCPYTTNSKNDFIYHKQFHRPKRTAEFKCEYCDYWVVHKRLLKQHMRLHTKKQREPETASVLSSPAKSLYSDPGLVNDPAELAELAAIKQKMISAKVTASLSRSPVVSPMKLASSLTTDTEKPSYVLKNGLYRKLHKCKKCPYTNVRARNMQLHEMMHGPRPSPHPLMKCPYCDYHVGSKGLLSHHMKVHQKSYGDTPENDAEMAEAAESGELSDHEILPEQKVDTLLQISRFKRFACEKCPYASAKRQHFERHLELHGSRQRYTCQYCDYSVPSNNLLLQHTKLHMMPNQNLLASQSITNLHHLDEVPADVALASALPPADSETTVTISVIHDHLGLYENSIYDSEPKKLYRCDRCPYANVRRDYLLLHLKFHMVASAYACPYCDYSAPKQALLTQHIRVHFCPLPELSDWLLENGQTERETSHRQMDLGEALKVARDYQTQGKSKAKLASERALAKSGKATGKENVQNGNDPVTYMCQYCDREFSTSETLIKHELQHLIGNHFERSEYVDRNKKEIEKQAETKEIEGGVEEETKQGDSNPQDEKKEGTSGVEMNGTSSQHLSSDLNDHMGKSVIESNDDIEKSSHTDTSVDNAVCGTENKEPVSQPESKEEKVMKAVETENGNEDVPQLSDNTVKTETEVDEEKEPEKEKINEQDLFGTETSEKGQSSKGEPENKTAEDAVVEQMQVDEDDGNNDAIDERMQVDEVDDGSKDDVLKSLEKAEESCSPDIADDQVVSDIKVEENKAESSGDVNEKDLLSSDNEESAGLRDGEEITEHDVKLLEDDDL